jgi:hypothetical protein
MIPECWFNSQVLRNTFHKKQLAVKTSRHVSASHNPVTAVTDYGDDRHYAPRSAAIASGTARGLW